MQALKPYFPIPFFGLAGFVLFYSLYQLFILGFDAYIWIGVLLSSIPSNIFVISLLSKKISRTHSHLPIIQALTHIAVICTILFYNGHIVPILLSMSVAIGLVIYVYWYSKYQTTKSKILEIGRPLPDFPIFTLQGEYTNFAKLKQDPALILFFRGNWCPLCFAQIKEIAESYQELDRRGISIYMIGSQHEVHTIDLSKKFDVPITFLSDKDHEAGKALDLVDKYGTPRGMDLLGYDTETLLPTVVMTDKEGMIYMIEQTDSYRIRPEPKTFLEAYDRLTTNN